MHCRGHSLDDLVELLVRHDERGGKERLVSGVAVRGRLRRIHRETELESLLVDVLGHAELLRQERLAVPGVDVVYAEEEATAADLGDQRVAVERVAKLVEDKQSGKISGRTELTLDLVSIRVNGRMVDLNTEEVTTSSESRTAKSGKVVGGTAAVGAILGGIAVYVVTSIGCAFAGMGEGRTDPGGNSPRVVGATCGAGDAHILR